MSTITFASRLLFGYGQSFILIEDLNWLSLLMLTPMGSLKNYYSIFFS